MKGGGEGSDLRKVHYRQCVLWTRPIASGGQVEKVTSKSKVSVFKDVLGKDERRLREDGPRATEI